MPEELLAALVADFEESLKSRFLIAKAIGFNGDVLFASLDHEPKVRSSNGSSSTRYVEKPHNLRIHHCIDGEIFEIELDPFTENIHKIQLLPNGCYLIGGARGTQSMHIFGSEGHYMSTWNGGDAIEDVQVAPDGKIWVSHFDEGFGEEGSEGLYCFNQHYEQLFDFNQCVYTGNLGEIDQPIVDCYMLNVASANDVWVCAYTGFRLYHLHDFHIKQDYEVAKQMVGAYAFAISKGKMIFVGGYHFREQLFWYDLHLKRLIEIKPVAPNGKAIKWKYAQGRGNKLFLWENSSVFSLNVDEVWPQ